MRGNSQYLENLASTFVREFGLSYRDLEEIPSTSSLAARNRVVAKRVFEVCSESLYKRLRRMRPETLGRIICSARSCIPTDGISLFDVVGGEGRCFVGRFPAIPIFAESNGRDLLRQVAAYVIVAAVANRLEAERLL